MTAIDKTSETKIRIYEDGKWSIKKLYFPVAMDNKQIREYLGFENTCDCGYPGTKYPLMKIYIKQNGGDEELLEYFIELEAFYSTMIICKGFPDLIHLIQELKPFLDISMNDEFMNFKKDE